MSEFITRTARLVPYSKRPKQVPSFVTAYSYEPLPDEPGAALGSLFVVMEVLVSGRPSEDVADLIIEAVGDHYYNHEQEDNQPLARFEAAIKAVNRELTEYVNQGNAAWIGKISAVIGVQFGNELHISHTGSSEALLYRGTAATKICDNQTPARPTAPSKTFGSIASGQLEVGDRLLLATPALIHQLSLRQLQEVITHNSPNHAIAEITQLLRSGSGERIAAFVIEITTPELAALEVRSEQPDEIQLGSPETPLEAAKYAAAPLAQATITSSRHIGAAARTGWSKGQPVIHRAGLSTAAYLRKTLSTPGGRRWLIIAIIAIILIASGLLIWRAQSSKNTALINEYKTVYKQYSEAETALQNGEKDYARSLLANVRTKLSQLQEEKKSQQFDAALKHSDLASNAPRSIGGLLELTNDKLDELEGLEKISVLQTINTSGFKDAQPHYIEVTNGLAYLFDPQSKKINVVNLSTKTVKQLRNTLPAAAKIKATTLSSANDGIYLLTDKPSVWFLRFDNETIAEQTISMGQWSAAKDIASYGSNLYLLNDNAIYKHTKTLTGFAAATEYVSSKQSPGIKTATTLAIDGSVYTLSNTALDQYLAGSLKQSATTPSSLSKATRLRSISNSGMVIAISSTSSRIGVWDTRQTMAFVRQFKLNGITNVRDAAYDARTNTFYAMTSSGLVQFQYNAKR